MSNPYNTTEISLAILEGNYRLAIYLLSRMPFNHKRYAYLYNRIATAMLADSQTIGAFTDDIYRAFLMLKQPYIFTYKYLRTQKGGVIK